MKLFNTNRQAKERRLRVINRLQEQLSLKVKTVKKTIYMKDILTDKDKIRINKELETILTRI